MILLTHSQKSAKGHHGVGDVSALLVDHDVVDRPDFLTAGVVNVSPGNLVARDQIRGFSFGFHEGSSELELEEITPSRRRTFPSMFLRTVSRRCKLRRAAVREPSRGGSRTAFRRRPPPPQKAMVART